MSCSFFGDSSSMARSPGGYLSFAGGLELFLQPRRPGAAGMPGKGENQFQNSSDAPCKGRSLILSFEKVLELICTSTGRPSALCMTVLKAVGSVWGVTTLRVLWP